MSTTLTSQPQQALTTGNCGEFQLELTTAGSGAIEKKAGYKIFLDGQEVTQEDEFLPYTGSPEKVDVMPVIKGLVKSEIPGFNVSSIGDLTGAVKDTYLRYGHIDLNTEDCSQTSFLTQTSDTITAIDGRLPGWFNLSDLVSQPVVLSEKPAKVNVGLGQRDWLCVYRHSGPIGIKVVGYNANNSQVYYQTLTVTSTRKVKAIPIGPGNAFFPFSSAIRYYDVEIHNAALPYEEFNVLGVGTTSEDAGPGITSVVWSSRFIVTACSNTSPSDEIYFKEPTGGWAGFKLKETNIGANVTSSRFFSGRSCDNSLTIGGITRAEIQSLEQVTAVFEQPYSDGLARYLNSFFSSSAHYWKYVKDGTVNYRKVNLLDGAYQGLQSRNALSSVQFTFDISKPL